MDMKAGGKLRNYITKEEIDRYFAKSGYDKIYITNLVATDWGFASWDVDNEGCLLVMSCYGDIKLWEKFFVNLAKQLGLKNIKFITKRNPKSWEKLLKNCKIDSYVLKYKIKEE
jgi:hypothetical protein